MRDVDDQVVSALLCLLTSCSLLRRHRPCLFEAQRYITHAKHQTCELPPDEGKPIEQMEREKAQAKSSESKQEILPQALNNVRSTQNDHKKNNERRSD